MPAPCPTDKPRQKTAESEVWRAPWSSTWNLHQFFRRFVLDRNVNKGERRPAERLIFAEDQRQIAPDLGVGDRNRGENFGANIVLHIRAGDEANAHIGG